MAEKIVLAYSGGLDTTVAIRWLSLERGYEVVALTIDVGNERDFTAIRERALAAGAVAAEVRDAKELFVRYFCFPALAAGAVYEGQYPLATALARPLIAKLLVDAAREHGATAVAHGCTGKGNDQVRFDVATQALAPDLKIIAPVREWRWARDEEIAYALEQQLPVTVTAKSPYSIDENLWGRSVELGVLEDPWTEPPEEVFAWTRPVAETPDEPAYIEVGFEHGIPTSLDGEALHGLELVQRVHALACEHGVGRIDHVENRLVGIKSREVYEAPAATVLLKAHQALETLTLSKPQLRFKERVAQEYADLIYNGLWFTSHHQDLAAYTQSNQRHTTGTVRMRLHKGRAVPVGRKSPKSLYSHALATYDKGDQFDQSAAVGFIKLWGLPVQIQAQAQILPEAREPLQIATPGEQGATDPA